MKNANASYGITISLPTIYMCSILFIWFVYLYSSRRIKDSEIKEGEQRLIKFWRVIFCVAIVGGGVAYCFGIYYIISSISNDELTKMHASIIVASVAFTLALIASPMITCEKPGKLYYGVCVMFLVSVGLLTFSTFRIQFPV